MRTIQSVRRHNARQLMDEQGGPTAFAHRLQRDPSYISQITGAVPRKSIGDKMARHIEQACRKPEGWLDESHEKNQQHEASLIEKHPPDDFVMLGVARLQRCTSGELSVTTEERMGGVPRAALQRLNIAQDDALLVEVHGDAHGWALPDGSLVAVNTKDASPREGKLYALRDDDLLRVRILMPQPGGGLTLRTFNRDDYPDEHLDANQVGERIEILGRVFWSATTWQ